MRRAVPIALVVLLVGGLAPMAGPDAPAVAAEASREAQVDAELERLRNEISNSLEEENRVLAELRVSQRVRKDLDARVAALDRSLALAQQELDAVSARLDEATASVLAASTQVEEAKRQLEDATALLKDQAINAYIRFAVKPSIPDAVRDIDDVNEVPRVVALAETVTANQGRIVEQHRRLRAALSDLEAEANAAKAALAADRERVTRQKAELEADRAEQASVRAAARAEEVTEERLLARLQAGRAEDEQRVRDLQASSDSITALLRRLQAGQPPAPSGKGVLAYPIASPVVTSNFGWRAHPIFGDRRLHAGTDFKGGSGTPILAAGDGKVVYAGVMRGYGNVVIIDHGRSLATLYAHQSRIGVSNGQRVKRGQVIGAVGATGYVTGPHLHFEARVGGTPVDARAYL